MKRIPLTHGKFAIVDDDDFEHISQLNWYLSDHNYAVTTTSPHKYLHRLINKTPNGYLTDHINRNTLDNRKSNLRTCDMRVNVINRPNQINNTSGHKGISWSKQKSRWETYIWNMGTKIYLGMFVDIDDAIKARKSAEEMYHAI